ncbi:MAG: BrnA antitoxin family protein [Methylocystis sp.]|nr:BrnA antitoxin family protein [Methylocystis sp.]MCA3589523.1 BrnA antitoxin family protein [Methylocystis sp.]MCA3593091.1 BrnA antitoxin family protein [Methylocystis sp.]
MTAKDTKASKVVRYGSVDELPPAPPLSKAVKAMSDAEVERRAAADPDAGAIPEGFWDSAKVAEPEGTEQITLRLPRKVLGHFKSTGKGYQSRISAVLSSYVDAKKAGKMG